LHPPDKPLLINVLRGSHEISLVVLAVQQHDAEDDLASFVDPQNLIADSGLFVHDLNDKVLPLPPYLRIASGVVVVAQSSERNSCTLNLQPGDILHTSNRQPIESVQQLRSMIERLNTGQAAVLQIERARKLQYLAFDWGE
jgi:S1-C subfamily serine protease